MTFLDDFQAPYKVQGAKLVGELLERVPKELLKRTGVDQLLFIVRMSSKSKLCILDKM